MNEQVKHAILQKIPGADIDVQSQGSHFNITVTSSLFEGKGLLEKQRMVYSAISSFMSGPDAPIHAVDQLKTLIPEAS